jgi:hypothetical protein
MKKPFRRTRLWVDPAFQSRLLVRMGLYFLLYLLMAWHVGFVVEVLQHVATETPNQTIDELYAEFFWKQKPLLLAMVIVLPLFLRDLTKFSHRVAGPLVRCRQLMRDMASGKPVPEFKPRKHDLMPEFFQAFAALIKELNGRLAPRANGEASHPPPEHTEASNRSVHARAEEEAVA